jgi:signal recognition particle receptor subunit beta
VKYKVIISGPVGAGKTTAINTLTDHSALLTDATASDLTTSNHKETTTVAMDYGTVKLTDGTIAHVYGTPGQQRFEFMWDILIKGAHSLILLLDNSRNYPFRDLKNYTNNFADFIKENGLVVGVTWSDKNTEPSIEAYQQWLKSNKINASATFVDARNKSDMMNLLETSFQAFSQNEFSENQIDGSDLSIEPFSMDIDTKLYESLDTILLTETSLENVQKIEGVLGVTLTNSMGELLQSTIEDNEMNEFIAFLSGITSSFTETSNIGEVHRIMMRGPNDDNLTVFVEKERSLGVRSEKGISIPALSQQIEDMLQWSES